MNHALSVFPPFFSSHARSRGIEHPLLWMRTYISQPDTLSIMTAGFLIPPEEKGIIFKMGCGDAENLSQSTVVYSRLAHRSLLLGVTIPKFPSLWKDTFPPANSNLQFLTVVSATDQEKEVIVKLKKAGFKLDVRRYGW